ncbi:MAG: hypothetical protein JW812_02455 [Alphaproteobacteria bacterium]|nr:hypothetical protein [Alphaproteobacteria bacterium]MBN2779855.1 hypothetical protein [Alphaproteobacteria bacterium]
MFDILMAVLVFLATFSVLRATHSAYFSVMKTIVMGAGGFFFYLIGLLSFFTGAFGIVLASIGMGHRYFRPKNEIFTMEYQAGLALLLTLWGNIMGYEILFILLLPELLDLLIYVGARFFKTILPKEKLLCHLEDMHDLMFKRRVALHVVLVFLGGGLVGLSKQPVAIVIMAILATGFIYFRHKHESK